MTEDAARRAPIRTWWERNRAKIALLAVAGVALGGIVCMATVVILLIVQSD
jgi:hypothetical protein